MWPSVQLQSTVQVGCSPRSKAVNAVISNGPGRLWQRLIPLTGWPPYSLGSLAPWTPSLPGLGRRSSSRARDCGRPTPDARRPASGARRWYPPLPPRLSRRTGHVPSEPGALAAIATFVRAWVAPPESGRAAGAVGFSGSRDRVALGAAFPGRGRQRVPMGAPRDPNDPR